jgi:PAS domain-containing protein
VPADPVQDAADRLYGLPFDEFIPERDATAQRLRRDGDKETAAAVAKLPKPSQVAWVANQLGRAGADDLLSAGDAIREAQLGGGGREALREATAAQRSAVDALLKEAEKLRPLSRDLKDRLRALLLAVAGDEDVRAAFEAGRLVEEPSAGGAWPVGAFVAPASTPASREGTKRAAPRKPPEKRESAAARRKREEKERKAADRARKEAERQREEAERRKLERRLAAARDAADEAKQRLDMAKDAYERATHEVARIEEQLS